MIQKIQTIFMNVQTIIILLKTAFHQYSSSTEYMLITTNTRTLLTKLSTML